MSNYYDYREVKVMIAHKLMDMEGWKVYGYHADESDSMTDYYSPAYWGGVAEKNGYILCVDVYGASEGQEIREYNNKNNNYNNPNIISKIEQLKNFTTDRGATEAEEATAKEKIKLLQIKMQEEQNENNNNYVIVGRIPAHQAHPNKCNWHIEKDGVIIAKGNGILKYSSIDQYFNYDSYKKDLEMFKTMSKEEYIDKKSNNLFNHGYWYDTKEKALQSAESSYKTLQEDSKLINKFNNLINKFDTTCGCLVGDGEIEQFEKITVTEYKKEIKAVETENGSIKEGQCFILKTGFNYNRYKGLVYRIHESEYNGKKYYNAYKLNGKLTKECTGKASANNSWSYIEETFLKWIEKGSISWCELQEVKTPYEVEKLIKKTLSSTNKNNTTKINKKENNNKQEEQTIKVNKNNYTYDIKEDIDTRDNSKIYVVKIIEKLERDEYISINNNMKKFGGYYSKFKHGFIFKDNPSEKLKGFSLTEAIEKQTEEQKQEKILKQQQVENQKLTDKIEKNINSLQSKIDALSGNYKTNTWKRMREQDSRDNKKESLCIDIKILNYVRDKLFDNEPLTELEKGLTVGAFRDTIHSYYIAKYGRCSNEIKFPTVDYNLPLDGWYNKEVPQRQNKLKKYNINNTEQLNEAVEEYKNIYDEKINRSINQTQNKIKQLERQYKMQQKGDINFTPLNIVEQLIQYAKIDSNSKVLEPSAGIGNIADKIKEITNNLDVIEQMSHFCELLKLKGHNVVSNDFLEYNTSQKYDAIIMNPPFSDEVRHIKHAYELLNNEGILVSISSPHWTFANDKKSIDFRQWLENEVYFTEDLQSGTFEMTNVSSKILIIEKTLNNKEQTA